MNTAILGFYADYPPVSNLLAMISSQRRTGPGRGVCGHGANRALQYVQELLNPSFFFLGQLSLTAKQSWIKFGGEQCILEAFHHPVENGNDHLDVHIFAQLVALQSKADKAHGAVRIFTDQEAVNLALQHKVGAVIAEQRNTVRNPVLVHQVLGADEPVAQHFEKASQTNFRGRIQVFGEGADGTFIDFEEQPVFAAEVLEDGAFGDAKGDGDVADSGRVIAMLGKMLRGGFDDAAALCLRAWAGWGLTLVEGWSNAIAGDSWHRE